MTVRLRFCAIVLASLVVTAVSTTANAAPRRHARSAAAQMLAAIDLVRARAGERPVAVSRVLERDTAGYASTMLAENRWAHAVSFQRGTGFRRVGEILARDPGWKAAVGSVVLAWLASPEHRPILLGRAFNWVGIALKRGRMGGAPMTVWVVRFGLR